MKLSLWKTEAIQPAINDFEASIIERNIKIVHTQSFERRRYLMHCNTRDQCMIDDLRKELNNRKLSPVK